MLSALFPVKPISVISYSDHTVTLETGFPSIAHFDWRTRHGSRSDEYFFALSSSLYVLRVGRGIQLGPSCEYEIWEFPETPPMPVVEPALKAFIHFIWFPGYTGMTFHEDS